jgi:hypothetical protein
MITGPRAALLAMLATLSMLALFLRAEFQLVSALQVAVALQKADPARPLPPGCDSAALVGAKLPLESFDGRMSGYGYSEAQTILCAMEANGGEGKRKYLDGHFPFDIAFPLFYGPAIASLWLYLLAFYGWNARLLKCAALVPIAASLFDLAENITVRSLVVAGPPPEERLVAIASALTATKCALLSLSTAVTLSWLLWHLVSRSLFRDTST